VVLSTPSHVNENVLASSPGASIDSARSVGAAGRSDFCDNDLTHSPGAAGLGADDDAMNVDLDNDSTVFSIDKSESSSYVVQLLCTLEYAMKPTTKRALADHLINPP